MAVTFLDTCALKHRYCPIEPRKRRRIKRIVSDRRNQCYISEATILEMNSALGSYCREAKHDTARFDRLDTEFMADIASERLRVCDIQRNHLERARHLMRYAGVSRARAIGSMDALIAVTCLDLALARGERISFWTDDRKLWSVLCDLDAFKGALVLNFLTKVVTT